MKSKTPDGCLTGRDNPFSHHSTLPGTETSFASTGRAENQCKWRRELMRRESDCSINEALLEYPLGMRLLIVSMSILVKHMSVGRQEAFDHFRRGNALNQKFEEHKRMLKQRYEDAKTLAEEINQFRNRISKPGSSPTGRVHVPMFISFSRQDEGPVRTDAFAPCCTTHTR